MSTTYRVPGAVLTEREHSIPLDHGRPDGPRITVFTREVAAPDGAKRPYLLFLQGGKAALLVLGEFYLHPWMPGGGECKASFCD